MVAPHDTGDLVRSLIRVPGSGTDRAAGAQWLDLARASSLAASVPVPQTLPPALANLNASLPPALTSVSEKLVMANGVDVGIVDETEVNPSNRKRSSPSDAATPTTNTTNTTTTTTPTVTKRARVMYMTKEQILSLAGRIVPVDTPNGPILVLQGLQAAAGSGQGNLKGNLSGASVSQLIQERDNLREENQRLQHRLNLFQQLFKDKKRLGSVVKRLGVELP